MSPTRTLESLANCFRWTSLLTCAGFATGNENGESSELTASDTSWDESRPHTLAELSPIETLREIEAWIAAQNARTRTNNRVLAEFQAACADAEARADNLALELEVAQRALHTAIAHLKAEHTAQSTAFEELAATRAREQQSSAVREKEVRAAAETLATEFQALEERYRRSAKSVAASEAELAESRATRTALEETLRTVRTSNSAHAARVAELEALATDLGHALEAQTEATKRANASTETFARELADERTRASALEAQLRAAVRHATDQSAAAQSTETALKMHLEQLAASQDRLANFEREATYQSEWRATCRWSSPMPSGWQNRPRHRDVRSRTNWGASGLNCSAKPSERKPWTPRSGNSRWNSSGRAMPWTNGNSSCDVSSTMRTPALKSSVGSRSVLRARTATRSLRRLSFRTIARALVPLDDSDMPAIPLGRHTTIGRAPESNLRLRDSTVSRRHAVVTIGPNGAFIEDLRSVNGVTVNCQRIRHACLADGDVIELGAKRFRFTLSAAVWNASSVGHPEDS